MKSMKRLNLILTLTSLTVILVTVERFSFTGKIILQPYNFLRLHEVIQMSLIILITAILPFFLLKEVTNNFELLKSKKGTLFAAIFIIGIYFYATGNGAHEIASYIFNTFCNTKKITGAICGSMFFNDYYFGNIVYFLGAYLFTIPLILFERMNPDKTFKRNDFIILGINGFIYSLTIFAYSGFDRVFVGLIYSLIMTATVITILFTAKIKKLYLPYTLYTAGAYLFGTIASLIIRLH